MLFTTILDSWIFICTCLVFSKENIETTLLMVKKVTKKLRWFCHTTSCLASILSSFPDKIKCSKFQPLYIFKLAENYNNTGFFVKSELTVKIWTRVKVPSPMEKHIMWSLDQINRLYNTLLPQKRMKNRSSLLARNMTPY